MDDEPLLWVSRFVIANHMIWQRMYAEDFSFIVWDLLSNRNVSDIGGWWWSTVNTKSERVGHWNRLQQTAWFVYIVIAFARFCKWFAVRSGALRLRRERWWIDWKGIIISWQWGYIGSRRFVVNNLTIALMLFVYNQTVNSFEGKINRMCLPVGYPGHSDGFRQRWTSRHWRHAPCNGTKGIKPVSKHNQYSEGACWCWSKNEGHDVQPSTSPVPRPRHFSVIHVEMRNQEPIWIHPP